MTLPTKANVSSSRLYLMKWFFIGVIYVIIGIFLTGRAQIIWEKSELLETVLFVFIFYGFPGVLVGFVLQKKFASTRTLLLCGLAIPFLLLFSTIMTVDSFFWGSLGPVLELIYYVVFPASIFFTSIAAFSIHIILVLLGKK